LANPELTEALKGLVTVMAFIDPALGTEPFELVKAS
jgi:hypothetical protein